MDKVASVQQNVEIMNTPLQISYDSWGKEKQVKTLLHIPGRPLSTMESVTTHVRVTTRKTRYGLATSFSETTLQPDGMAITRGSLIGDGGGLRMSNNTDLHAMPTARATEKALLTCHKEGLTVLRNKRPDLFNVAEEVAA